MLDAYFERLVFHFHDELLLLFLSGAGVLKLGFDAVHLQLVLHDCGETAGGFTRFYCRSENVLLALSCAENCRRGKESRREMTEQTLGATPH